MLSRVSRGTRPRSRNSAHESANVQKLTDQLQEDVLLDLLVRHLRIRRSAF